MEETMLEMTTSRLMECFREQGMEVTEEPSTGQIVFQLSYEKVQCPVFVRIYPDGQLLQFMLFFPMAMQPNTQADTARLLHFFNKELDIPGFGMDEASGVCFFRCMIPVSQKKLSKDIFLGYLNTLKVVCENFFSSIGVITSRTMTFEALIAKAKQKASAASTEAKKI